MLKRSMYLANEHKPDDHRRRSGQPDFANLRLLLEDSEDREDHAHCHETESDESITETSSP